MAVSPPPIEFIFSRLLARYGSSWRQKYAGVPPEAVAADWDLELEGVQRDSVEYALQNLPVDFPPTAGQFRAICMAAPRRDHFPKLPPPKPDPGRLKAAFERLHSLVKGRSPTQWIADLEARQAGGEKLSIFQKQCLANARENLSHRAVADVTITTEDSRRTEELKATQSARVAQYLRDHPELQP